MDRIQLVAVLFVRNPKGYLLIILLFTPEKLSTPFLLLQLKSTRPYDINIILLHTPRAEACAPGRLCLPG